jgi:hypothetical protein
MNRSHRFEGLTIKSKFSFPREPNINADRGAMSTLGHRQERGRVVESRQKPVVVLPNGITSRNIGDAPASSVIIGASKP